MLGTSDYCYERSLECLRVGQGHPHTHLGWGISARVVFRTGPSMKDEAPWELEGRGRPIWDSLGSGLMDPRVSPISGHTLA